MTDKTPAQMALDVVERLVGTASNTVEGVLADLGYPEEMGDNTEFLQELDNQVFVCDGCGWWCGTDEYGEEEGMCDECSPRD